MEVVGPLMMTAKAIMLSMMVGNAPMDQHNVEETYCMALNIYYEARGEGWKGKAAVAHVVQNRVEHPKYPNTVCGVVLQSRKWKGRVIRDKCQFAWYCDGRSDVVQLTYKKAPRRGKVIEPNMIDWRRSVETAIQVMDGWSRDVSYGATHYFNHNISTPSWSTVYPTTIIIGNHTFLARND
jgi:spore germination cell wall hydrolase CwlJ-like protein